MLDGAIEGLDFHYGDAVFAARYVLDYTTLVSKISFSKIFSFTAAYRRTLRLYIKDAKRRPSLGAVKATVRLLRQPWCVLGGGCGAE